MVPAEGGFRGALETESALFGTSDEPARTDISKARLAAYGTVAVAAALHSVPLVFTAKPVKVCVPGFTSTAVETEVEFVSVYFFTPSTHTSICAIVPVTVELASTTTEVALMLAPLVGQHKWTPAVDGALQPEGTVKVKFSCTRVLLMSEPKYVPYASLPPSSSLR
jgi:hypothetical protein